MTNERGVEPENELLGEVEQEASRVLPPPPGHPRFPLLDSMRALAAISVMLVHVGIFTGGFAPWYKQLFAQLDIGVPFFFLLSGFLLYRPMLASRVTGLPKQKRSAYARNRFFRIMPAYWVVLTVAAIVPGFYGAFTDNWWVYYSLLQSFPIYTPEGACVVNQFDCGFPVAWSLGIEVLFYIALPFFAAGTAALASLFGKRHWVAVELSVLAVLTAVSLYIQRSVPLTDLHQILFYSPIGRGWWFALGMGLAVASVWAQLQPREPRAVRWVGSHPNLWWLLGGALYVFTAIVLLDPTPTLAAPVFIEQSRYLEVVVVFGIIPLLLLLPAIFGHDRGGFVRSVLQHPALVWLGLISYGIFLWHFPVIRALDDIGAQDWLPSLMFPVFALLTFIGTVICAAASFYLIERPLMRWSRRHKQSEPATGD